VPERAGIGYRVMREKVEQYTVDTAIFSK